MVAVGIAVRQPIHHVSGGGRSLKKRVASDLKRAGRRVPRYLHRYRGAEEVDCGRLEDLISHRRVWASSPRDFNDPYDARLRIDFTGSEADWLAFFRGVAARRGLPSSWVDQMVASGAPGDPSYHLALVRDIQGMVDATGFMSFCESETDPMMWALYASGHRGVCLRFDSSRRPFNDARPVRYEKRRLRPRFNDPAQEIVDTALLTKSDRWEGEREWRVICYEREAGYQVLERGARRAVIVGLRTPERTRKEVVRLTSGASPRIEALQIVRGEDYELLVKELK